MTAVSAGQTDAPLDATTLAQLVLVAEDEAQGWRTRRNERLDHVFEEKCDWISQYGRAGHLAVDARDDTGDLRLTYDELDRRANQLARYLRLRGAKPGDRVALLFDKNAYSYIGMLAVLKISAAYIPLDVGFPPDRMAYICEDARASFLLSMSHVPDKVDDFYSITANGAETIFIDSAAPLIDEMDARRLIDAERGFHKDQLAYIIYTSGSTGRPKGVAIDHPSICNFVRVAAEVYGIRPRDRVYQGLTIAFDFSFEEIWVPWASGATLVPKPPGRSLLGADLHEFLSNTRVTAMCCVPTLLATIEDDLPDLRFLLVSGEACPQDLIVRWWRPDRRFLNVYGPTEATVTATWTELHPDKAVTIGVPLPTYCTVILDVDDPQRALPHGETGEIGIAGIGLAVGYLNRDDLTSKAFIDDFLNIPANPSGKIYRTGDLGRVNQDMEIEYLGRIDLQVKIRGYRIELTEIESVMLQVPGIAQAVVDTFKPNPETTELVGYYSLRKDCPSLDEEILKAQLRERLPSYMVPAYLEHLDVIPMTPQDKADRKNLPPPRQRSAPAQGEVVAAATEMQQALADALGQTLNMSGVSIDSHFFDDLSANSLLMAQFSTRVRKLGTLPPLSMKDIYLNPTIRQLAAAMGDTGVPVAAGAGAAAALARPVGPPSPPREVVRGSSSGYLLTGVVQLLFFLLTAYLGALALTLSFDWLTGAVDETGAPDLLGLFGRSAVLTVGGFLVAIALPILGKWILVGQWTPKEIRLWSGGYLWFWMAKVLMQVNPMVLFAGSPLFVLYLRAMGAKIGKGVTIHSRSVPVATDLITIGDGVVIRKDCSYSGYRAVDGVIQIGAVSIGRYAHVGEKTVLDINTSMGEGSELGHSSALHSGQSVPAGQTWHGCPAEPASTSYRTCPPASCTTARKLLYSVYQLVALLVGGAVAGSTGVLAITQIPALAALLEPGSTTVGSGAFYVTVAWVSAALFFGGIVTGLVYVMVVPRILHSLFITAGKVYPLYGFHYLVQGSIKAATNQQFYMDLFGDSSAVVHYLRLLGYRMTGRIVQTGSNFGAELKQDSPYLTTIGTETMVSDALSIMNTDYSGSSFRVNPVTIGSYNFMGNYVAWPSQGRIGDNVLLATKVLVPIDGPIRENVGLLGSPPFEIPRSVERDAEFDELKDPAIQRSRLAAKNRHNTVTALIFLLVRYVQVLGITVLAALSLDYFRDFGALAIVVDLLASLLFFQATQVLAERAARGFSRLSPQFCSIYDPYFWSHERLWKLLATPVFNGTPFKNVLWRLLGVRIGRRVFDDGCSIPEKTLVSIGDDAILNAGSIIQCHSLEDGTFKSDHTVIGAGATLGVHAFVHYGVTMRDASVLDADSFLMKGEEVGPGEWWAGNPANEVRGIARPSDAIQQTMVLPVVRPRPDQPAPALADRAPAQPVHLPSEPAPDGLHNAALRNRVAELERALEDERRRHGNVGR
ncbi:MAG: Pls/PosA family non-ribosomal peptide synthetase [Pseudonocardia sp.]